jgi:hypothetical protein
MVVNEIPLLFLVCSHLGRAILTRNNGSRSRGREAVLAEGQAERDWRTLITDLEDHWSTLLILWMMEMLAWPEEIEPAILRGLETIEEGQEEENLYRS